MDFDVNTLRNRISTFETICKTRIEDYAEKNNYSIKQLSFNYANPCFADPLQFGITTIINIAINDENIQSFTFTTTFQEFSVNTTNSIVSGYLKIIDKSLGQINKIKTKFPESNKYLQNRNRTIKSQMDETAHEFNFYKNMYHNTCNIYNDTFRKYIKKEDVKCITNITSYSIEPDNPFLFGKPYLNIKFYISNTSYTYTIEMAKAFSTPKSHLIDEFTYYLDSIFYPNEIRELEKHYDI